MFLTARRLVLATHLPQPISSRPVLATPTLFKIGSAFSSQVDPIKMGAAKDFVEKEIKENDVLVFSKSYCPVSHSASKDVHGARRGEARQERGRGVNARVTPHSFTLRTPPLPCQCFTLGHA